MTIMTIKHKLKLNIIFALLVILCCCGCNSKSNVEAEIELNKGIFNVYFINNSDTKCYSIHLALQKGDNANGSFYGGSFGEIDRTVPMQKGKEYRLVFDTRNFPLFSPNDSITFCFTADGKPIGTYSFPIEDFEKALPVKFALSEDNLIELLE